ncbi:SagB family peptide dehydrogenase [Streptomyces albus]|uniref:SagB family peptide dehydrogenase n=1 Tax=Streptomyces albus TaxID=1888 RepID=UPI00099DBB10|nr:SagB family peptide dehydrogenase [Streptomyces albus]
MTTMAGVGGSGNALPSWRSLHIALDKDEERAERLLLAVVAPWAAGRTAAGTLASWFPERTGADGGQLRVHVLSADDRSTADLAEAVHSAGEDVRGPAPETAEVPYEPDATPFGGAGGLALCAERFGDAARTAVETIRAAPSREKRLRAAAALLLASALAAEPEPRRTVQWLRGHASALAGTVDVAGARSRAEEDHFRNEAEWRRRHAATRDETTQPTTATGAWYRQQCELLVSLARLREAGGLDLAPGDVLRAFVRRLFGQLGLDARDEAYTAWLVSLDLVSPGPREPYFADSPASVDRLTHEYGKYFGARLMDQRPDMPGATAEGRQELPPALARVELERPAPAPDAPAFEEVLLARRSAYGYYGGPLSLGELGALLYYSAGVTARKTMPGADSSYPVRPYPSGGTRYPLRTLLYCHDVGGLARGTYLYDPECHALDQLGDRDICADLMRMAPATDPQVVFPPKAGGNLHVDDCPLWIFTVADLTFQRLHYGLRSYRLVLQESGHLAQNLALVATWLGKSSVGLGGFYDDTVNEALALDGVNSSVVYVHLVGVVQPPPRAAGARAGT